MNDRTGTSRSVRAHGRWTVPVTGVRWSRAEAARVVERPIRGRWQRSQTPDGECIWSTVESGHAARVSIEDPITGSVPTSAARPVAQLFELRAGRVGSVPPAREMPDAR